MTMAAQRLFVSQPTISQTIAELEEHYKVKLFTRHSKGLTLTKIGKLLLPHAKNIIKDFDALEDEMNNTLPGKMLRLGASVTVGRSVMGHLTATLKSHAPWLELYVTIESTQKIERKLLEEQLDVAIVEGEIKSRLIVADPVIDDCLVLICGQAHPLANRENVDLGELKNEVFILPEEGSSTRTLFEDVMRRRGLTYRIGWESSCAESIRQAVIRNQGLTILSARLVAKELTSGEIHFVPVADCMWKRHFLLVRHKDKKFSEPLELFINLAKTYDKYGFACPLKKSDLLQAAEKFYLIE